jgi:uncharacterized protein YdeI (YjbR/CyaY-like superfamily)
MQKKEVETFCPASQKEWRKWLKENHNSKQSIWLICYKKESGKPCLSWSETVDEALCFGWIDSTRKSIDRESFMQFFTKRKPTSAWSKINKEKVQRLIDKGLMTKAGFESIEIAKQNGSWSILDDVEELLIPKDLEKEFKTKPGSKDYFLSLSKSVKKMILHWVVSAKRPETRQKRINEIAELAYKNLKPKQFR